jgi:DNA-binding CsgD family transcriptional regulator
MQTLTPYDLQQVFQFVQQLNTIICLSEFPSQLLSILPLVIESDFTLMAGTASNQVGSFAHHPHDSGSQKTLASVLATNDIALLSNTQLSISYFLQNPVTMHHMATGDSSAHKISDFLNEPEMYQCEALYGEFLKPLGMLDQMSLVVTEQQRNTPRYTGCDSELINNWIIKATPTSVYLEEELTDLVIVIHRDSRNFSERDREILNLLMPHILQAYKNSRMISQLQQNCEQLHQVLEQTSSIIIHRDGSIKFVTELAEKLMRKYFSTTTHEQRNLPEVVKNWLQKSMSDWVIGTDLSTPTPPLRVIQDKHTLVVRLSVDAMNDQYLLTLEEQAPLDLPFTLLQELGLSQRESEILHWIFRDKSNQQISEILNLSHRTVQKHCEHIYDRLGINSRAAAITQVLEKLGIAIFS